MTVRSGVFMALPGSLSVAPMARAVDVQSTLTISQIINGLNYRTVMQEAKQNVAKHFSVIMRDPTTGLGATLTSTIVAGLTVSIKKGSLTTYSAITPVLTIVGTTGLLDLALTAPHLDTLGVAAINVSGPGVVPNDDLFIDVVAIDKTDSVRAGLTALPNASAGASGGLPTIDSNLNVAADVKRWLASVPDALSSGKLPADVKLWLASAPAALTASGFVQAMLTRWVSDNAGGTPNALVSGRVDANVGAASVTPDVNVTQWLGSAPDALSSGKLPADVKLWLATAPATLSSSGFLKVILQRWLTDDANGTPLALDTNLVQAEVSGTTVTADVNVVKWLGTVPSSLVSGLVPSTMLAIGGSAPTGIAAAVLDAARTGHVSLGSIGEGIALAAALLQGNFYMDNVTNTDPNGQTAARLRVFHTGSAAAAATAGGTSEGEFATFLVSTTYSGPNKVLTHRVVQQ